MNSKVDFDSIESVIADIRRGRMVIITDDECRENEGDFVMAAARVTPAAINFMARHGRGLICVAMSRDRLERIGLRLMPEHGGGDQFSTAFMESVDARMGVTTGISAHDRARTIRALIALGTSRRDLVSPGHTFPLQAKDGGVLRRAGHTEAAADLARLAGLHPAGVICEILKSDGAMARLPELRRTAKRHGLKIATVADLIEYRRKREKLIDFVRAVDLPTIHGEFRLHLFHSRIDDIHHVALVMGDPASARAPLVRVHSECLTGDVFGSQRCDCGAQIGRAMDMIAAEKCGVLLYMRQEGRGIGLANKIHAYALQEKGLDTVQANEKLGFAADPRDYGVGAQILCALGLTKIRLMTNNPRKLIGLRAHGLQIAARVPIVCPANRHSARYLRTKRMKLGHML